MHSLVGGWQQAKSNTQQKIVSSKISPIKTKKYLVWIKHIIYYKIEGRSSLITMAQKLKPLKFIYVSLSFTLTAIIY